MTSRTALALAPLALLLACEPDPAAVHRKAADDLLARSDFAGAAEEYARSLSAAPAQPKVWEKLAFARLKAGEKDRAADALVRLAELEAEPARRADAYRNAAGIFLQGAEHHAKAERFLLEVVRLDPADEASLTWLGELASERGGARSQDAPAVPEELEKAIGYYGRIIALRPDSLPAHANRRIVVLKYLAALDDERAAQAARLARAGRDAAAAQEAKDRIARAEARAAALQPLLAESMQKLSPARKASAR
jgi:tetratricopeptide (TPR) repeat protein